MPSRAALRAFVERPAFGNVIIALIIVNAVTLGLETSETVMSRYGIVLKAIDAVILKVFVLEIALRLYAYGARFFTKPWSVFDLAVVAVAFIPSAGAFSALRTLRVLRILRLISVVPAMRRVIEGLLASVPGIASVATIMTLFFYVFAVIATHLYSASFPEWFGSLGKTMYTLFQVMTLESWSMGIVRPVMEKHPSAWLFFISYILVTTFTMLNLFIAIIVNAMHSGADASAGEDREANKQEILARIEESERRIFAEMRALASRSAAANDGAAAVERQPESQRGSSA